MTALQVGEKLSWKVTQPQFLPALRDEAVAEVSLKLILHRFEKLAFFLVEAHIGCRDVRPILDEL